MPLQEERTLISSAGDFVMSDPQDATIPDSKLMERLGLLLIGSAVAALGVILLDVAF